VQTQLTRALLTGAALAGGAMLVAAALLTVLDVALRYAFNRPLPGTFELTQLAMSGIAFLGLGQAQRRGQHITIDLLYEGAPAPVRRGMDALAVMVSLLVAGAVTWRLLETMLRTRAGGEVTGVLGLPLYPAVGVAGAGFALFALALLTGLTGAAPQEALGEQRAQESQGGAGRGS
jgi:TRAP-type transport system small permease protein